MTFPDRMFHIDRGEPLTPEQVAERVRPRRLLVAPHEEREFTLRQRVVVHPQVFEDIEVAIMPTFGAPPTDRSPMLRYFHEVPPGMTSDPLSRREVRVCGLLMDTDPGLRLDEVVLRREERL